MRGLLIAVWLAVPGTAAAQSENASVWRIWAGHDTFAFRDAARTKPAMDGSPVEWRGTGPVAGFDWDHERPLRLHRINIQVSAASDFAYDTGIDTVAQPAGEHARFIEGGYEYRRYFARPILLNALRAGIGVRGGGELRTFRREHVGAPYDETDSALSYAAVLALRFRPTGRVGATAEWGNALAVIHGVQHQVGTDRGAWGGGWYTDLTARLEVRVATRTSLLVAWTSRGEGWMFDPRAYSDERHRIMAGLTYAK